MTTPATTPVPTWAAALGRIPSGLFVITVRLGDTATGMLASWVQQCSFEPPQLMLAIRRGRYVLDWLPVGATFTVNIVPEGEKRLLSHFGKGFEPGEPAFDGLDVEHSATGAVHLHAALACLDCQVVSQWDAGGDHVMIVGQPVAGALRGAGRPAVHVRKSGLNY
ncbi:MAG: flavin reductase family protein [Bacteroidales bacterium]|nr:flavin reductase family protein [Bacteroidales bacterium]